MPVANRLESAIPIRVKIAVPQEEEGVYLKPEMMAQRFFPGQRGDGEPERNRDGVVPLAAPAAAALGHGRQMDGRMVWNR